MSNLKPKTYYENYSILKKIGEKMKHGGPADIDTLVESFREAREAYSECRGRLLAIKDELEAEIAAISAAETSVSKGGAPAHA